MEPDGGGAVFIGVRHHSPACARLVARTITALRPAYVLVEGPADLNDRIDELLLAHQLPIAVFSSYRDGTRTHASWAPLCDYSPEWVALTEGRRAGAEVRFIDLPAWHPAFASRHNRYADAEVRYQDVVERLCAAFSVDNVDTLWDHLVEAHTDRGVEERLARYFDLVRGESAAGEDDTAREEYMAGWVAAALAHAGDRPVLVVTGGFHRPALIRLTAGLTASDWPAVPHLPEEAIGGSYLVPYSFKRLDAFTGYQSGMPSPGYYQRLWDGGLQEAGRGLTDAVVRRLRGRGQRVSTADLIAARAMAAGLARMRGHDEPTRADILDGLVSALVSEALEVPLPWTTRGPLSRDTHPAVVEMVAALSGERVGRLHPDTPLPPLVHDAVAEMERHGLDRDGTPHLDLTKPAALARSRVLHRMRVLGIPGVERVAGPGPGAGAALDEHWKLSTSDGRLPALIEAGAYGATLHDAARAVLQERIDRTAGDVEDLAVALFDAALCGEVDTSGQALAAIRQSIATATDLGGLGAALATVLGLWRHDRLLGVAGNQALGEVILASVHRVVWLVEGVRGGPAPADLRRLGALVATRDAVRHAGAALGLDRAPVLAVAGRLAADREVPPDLRGAAFGLGWSLGEATDPVPAVRGAATPQVLGDWLAGLFALARNEVLAGDDEDAGGSVLAVLDELCSGMPETDFLIALPALRQAFAFFPPRERETIARRLLDRRGLAGSVRSLLTASVAPELVASSWELEARVDALLTREGLIDEVPV